MLLVVESSRHWGRLAARLGGGGVRRAGLRLAGSDADSTRVVLGRLPLVDGVLALIAAIRTPHDHRWGLLLEGIAGIGAGLIAFFYLA